NNHSLYSSTSLPPHPPSPTPFPYTTLFRSPPARVQPGVPAREGSLRRRGRLAGSVPSDVPGARRIQGGGGVRDMDAPDRRELRQDRKSTRLNSSHLGISYAVFCLKKKKINM